MFDYLIEYEFVTNEYLVCDSWEQETETYIYHADEEEVIEELVEILNERFFDSDCKTLKNGLKEMVKEYTPYFFEEYKEELKKLFECEAYEEWEYGE